MHRAHWDSLVSALEGPKLPKPGIFHYMAPFQPTFWEGHQTQANISRGSFLHFGVPNGCVRPHPVGGLCNRGLDNDPNCMPLIVFSRMRQDSLLGNIFAPDPSALGCVKLAKVHDWLTRMDSRKCDIPNMIPAWGPCFPDRVISKQQCSR